MKDRPKFEDIPKLDEFQDATYYYSRLIEHVKNQEISKAVVVLEIIESIFSTFNAEDPNAPEKFIASLPDKHWREHTLPVPAGILKVLAQNWTHYKDNNGAYSFSQVLGIDGKGQGKQGALKKLKKLNRDVGLTTQVWIELMDEEKCTQAEAYQIVAARNNLEVQTVKNAYSEHNHRLLELIKAKG